MKNEVIWGPIWGPKKQKIFEKNVKLRMGGASGAPRASQWALGGAQRGPRASKSSAKVGQERAKVDQEQLKNGTRETKSENRPVLSDMEGTNCVCSFFYIEFNVKKFFEICEMHFL